ncbi:ADP-ribose pyrophosphatase [Flexivirga endophytica]|uniref:ADP-ribose pyrophosphatase n=1 Tax=Flexivirga endophytica TaxID=1849103 RepID=A0A916TGA9_9MICO|nr:NUDIX hydrolase [Flexivirga endophytica]GGB43419.1 ADP-ribose pyrophosphatase [Flexivirga endophytica]GHB68433.1 ADP-ribose pyrophosphatase [Flexivirga endophytica]
MTTTSASALRSGTVAAAGAVLWRREGDQLQVALVHRPKYDDWSWAKGKLDPGETWIEAAAREVLEETGFRPRIGIPLPRSVYSMQQGKLKEIRYWAAEVMSGSGDLENEIDEVAWLTPAQAQTRLSYVRDAMQLQAVIDADRAGKLQTWPLAVVRHADSVPRKQWDGDDPLRPLDDTGRRQALALVPVLAAYGIERLITSPSARCFATVQPYAAAAGIRLRTKAGLSEEIFDKEPDRAVRNLKRLLKRGEPAALCTHRPVLPAVLERLRDTAEPDSEVHEILAVAAEDGMTKGEALVCQISGRGRAARVLSVERHTPA